MIKVFKRILGIEAIQAAWINEDFRLSKSTGGRLTWEKLEKKY